MNSDDEAENYKDNTNGLDRQLEGISINSRVSTQAEAGEAAGEAGEAGHPAKSKRKSKRELKAKIEKLLSKLKKTIKKNHNGAITPTHTPGLDFRRKNKMGSWG